MRFQASARGRPRAFRLGLSGDRAGQTTTFTGATPLGLPLAPILAPWLDNHMFVGSTLLGFTVTERYPAMMVVVAHGKASWMQEVLEKMEASTRVIPLLHHYPASTEPEELWEHSNVMLGFDAEERMILKLPHDFADKVVWGGRATRTATRPAHGMPSPNYGALTGPMRSSPA